MNYFISQFGNPRGVIGKVFAKMMNVSNKKMYAANLTPLSRKTASVLEIGFGNGKQIELIKTRYPECAVYGIDMSEEMYKAAGKRLGNRAVLTLGRAESLPYEDNMFDVVMTTDTCYFWDDPDKVLSEIRRTLKNKGLFVNSYNTMYASSVKRSRCDALSDDASIIAAAERHGLTIVSASKTGMSERQIIMKKG